LSYATRHKRLSQFKLFSDNLHSSLGVISGIFVCLLTAVVVIDVIGRYLFSSPLNGSVEYSGALLALFVFSGITYTQTKHHHIKVTVLTERVSTKWRKRLNIFDLVFCFGIAALLTWQTLINGLLSLETREVGLIFPIPVYPVKLFVFVGFLLLAIQYLLEITGQIAGEDEAQ
jgi:TRAP-type C4-dicarboxylate transport system permease small subunit